MSEVTDLVDRARERRDLPPPSMRRAIRQAAGLSLEEVADALDVSRAAVQYWEAGRRFPRPQNLTSYSLLLRELQRLAG